MENDNVDVIAFNNNEYLVLDKIEIKGNKYLYLINNDKFINDTAIVKEKIINDLTEYTPIKDDDEFKLVLSRLILDYEKELLEFTSR